MANKTSIPLPIPTPEYVMDNELITRRTIEQIIQDIHSDIGLIDELKSAIVSKAMRRHQFLLMWSKGNV